MNLIAIINNHKRFKSEVANIYQLISTVVHTGNKDHSYYSNSMQNEGEKIK